MENRVFKNTLAMYGMNFAKMIFPFLTLPYLTRVLSVDGYAVSVYVKAIMQYFQLVVDFGFMLSGTKEVVKNIGNRVKLNQSVSAVLIARLILVGISTIIIAFIIICSQILNGFGLFTWLSFINVALSVFLFDYVFRGFERMDVLTTRFFIMKVIATILTFVFVKNDASLVLMPIFDILGTLIAIAFVLMSLKHLQVSIVNVSLTKSLGYLKESFIYFVSNVSTTAFNAFNTLVIGMTMTSSEIAFWGVCMQLFTGVQALYTPISDAIYPRMLSTRSLKLIKKVLCIFLPLISVGCTFTFFTAGFWLKMVGGVKYVAAAYVLRQLTPVMFLGFTSILFGWPMLGAIGKEKETTFSTVAAGLIQVGGVLLLAVTGMLSLMGICLIRLLSELSLTCIRLFFNIKFINEFNIE